MAQDPPGTEDGLCRLSEMARGQRGIVAGLHPDGHEDHGVGAEEMERRLLEMGFVEGAHLAVLMEGLIGRDPIAVSLDEMRVALRRREARAVLVRRDR
ncbi:FeoA family protein [Plastoroseomonas hellenica]|uniref:FeoA family protein n=1 Tax=Plastoroseomonas hellenica TaxID=2687306 RepID=UPI0020139322|nr:FeoA family protein [Plastoroseomonas hellenica]